MGTLFEEKNREKLINNDLFQKIYEGIKNKSSVKI